MELVDPKHEVKKYWEEQVCGARYATTFQVGTRQFFDSLDRYRYEQDYMLRDFAQFDRSRGKRILEVGLGTGADFVHWLRAGAEAHGRDLTEASIELVNKRLALDGLSADVRTGDAENLSDIPDNFVDLYYSWGCLHHTPNTVKAFDEAFRVLKPGGVLKVMIYHYPSVSAFLIWLLYGPLRLNFKHPRICYGKNVESPGTKLYKVKEARLLAKRFQNIQIRTYLAAGDLLSHEFSGKYKGLKWKLVKRLYPRWFIRHVVGGRFGTYMTIEATKSQRL